MSAPVPVSQCGAVQAGWWQDGAARHWQYSELWATGQGAVMSPEHLGLTTGRGAAPLAGQGAVVCNPGGVLVAAEGCDHRGVQHRETTERGRLSETLNPGQAVL